MNEIKWHKPVTSYLCRNHFNGPSKIEQFYGEGIDGVVGTHGYREAKNIACDLSAEYVWHKTGQTTWFVDSSMYELLSTCKVDDDLTGVKIPNDSVYFLFERGIFCDGFPVRGCLFFTPRSKISREIISRGLRIGMSDRSKDVISFYVDCGENGIDGGISENTPGARLKKWYCRRSVTGVDEDFSALLPTEQIKVQSEVMRVCVAAMMYYAARPERVVPFTLPRSQRYEYKGHRENFKRVVLPAIKNVYLDRVPGEPSGRTVTPHYRGFVYRVLRHEKYKRNDDGTLRVIEVEPCAIHPELMGKE